MTARSPYDTLITVYGGSGFLGRHVVRALAKRNYRIRVAVRRPELAGFLQPLGRVGQIHAVQTNLRHAPSVEMAARDAQVLINLVGILFERGRQRFDAVHAYGAEQVALAANAHGARMVHVSAIGADANSSSVYARRRSCLVPRTISSIALPPWRAFRRRCRWSVVALHVFSPCSSAMLPARSPTLLTGKHGRGQFMNWADLMCVLSGSSCNLSSQRSNASGS